MSMDWLVDGAGDQVNYALNDTATIRTPALEVTARLDRFENSQLAWYEAEARTTRDPASLTVAMPIDGPFIFLHVQLQGIGTSRLPGASRETITTESEINLRRSSVTNTALDLPAAHRTRFCGVMAAPDTLADWFGGFLPDDLRSFLAGTVALSPDIPSLESTSFRIMASRISDYLNPLRRIATEGIAMQLMTAYLQALCGRDAHDTSLTARETRAALDGRSILLADLRQPPSISELAGMVGITERRLDQAFRRLFGASVFRTLSDARLDHAYEVLSLGAVPVKELAFRLGYAHSASFSHAFRARFGVFPSQMRRS